MYELSELDDHQLDLLVKDCLEWKNYTAEQQFTSCLLGFVTMVNKFHDTQYEIGFFSFWIMIEHYHRLQQIK